MDTNKIFELFLGSFFTFLIGVLFAFFALKYKKIMYKIRFNRANKSKDKFNILVEDYNDNKERSYITHLVQSSNLNIPSQNVEFNDTGKSFYLDLTEEDEKTIKDKTRHTVINKSSEAAKVEFYSWISAFIEKHYKKLKADDLIKEAKEKAISRYCDLKMYNSDKLGIYSANYTKMEALRDDKEEPLVKINIFKTDYLTAQFMKALYQKLYKINDSVFYECEDGLVDNNNLNNLNKLEDFKFFFCFNGVIGMLINKDCDETFFVKRGEDIASPNHWHLSFDEGIKYTEDAYKGGRFHSNFLFNSIHRAMREELGISNVANEDIYFPLITSVLNPDKFEIDFLFYIFLEKDKFENINKTLALASDKEEIARIRKLKLTYNEVVEFVKEKDADLKEKKITPEFFHYTNFYIEHRKGFSDLRKQVRSR